VVKTYDLPGFEDLEFTPSADARWDYRLQLDRSEPARGFEVLWEESAHPWDTPPITLRTVALDPYLTRTTVAPSASELTLVPVGATTLRQTCFPHVDRSGLPLIPIAEWVD
jgi:hypothetical protein